MPVELVVGEVVDGALAVRDLRGAKSPPAADEAVVQTRVQVALVQEQLREKAGGN